MDSPDIRRTAWEILNRVFKKQAWAEEELGKEFVRASFSGQDRNLCRELVMGVIKARRFLDYSLEPRLRSSRFPDAPVANALRLGAYQILCLDKIPAYAAVHATVEMSKSKLSTAHQKLLNAVLRELSRRPRRPLPDPVQAPLEHLGVKYSFPDWLVKRWAGRYGLARTESALGAANRAPALWARVNVLQTSLETARERLVKHGVRAEFVAGVPGGLAIPPGIGAPGELPGFSEGWFYYQDPSSQLVGAIVDPQPGETCLDLCSAPGGKATHLAERMRDRGTVLVFDIHPGKVKRVMENAGRLKLKSLRPLKNLSGPIQADRVLVDAPCSGLGTMRRHAEIRWRIRERELSGLAAVQLELLESAGKFVKPGGGLVYSTCSTEPEENEEVVKRFLRGHAEFSLLPGPGPGGHPAARFWGEDGFFRTYPEPVEWDGIFAARMVKGQS